MQTTKTSKAGMFPTRTGRKPVNKPIPKLLSGSIIPSLKGSGGAGAVSQVAVAGELAVDAFVPDKKERYGLSYKPVGATAAKSGLKGAAMGASIGSAIPGIGTAVGAVVGGVAGIIGGAIKGKKEKKKILDEVARLDTESIKSQNMASERYQNSFTSYRDTAYAKQGMMIPGMGSAMLPSKKAVILGGQLHKDKGRYGNGNPGVDLVTGEVVVEVEAKEMLLTDSQTEKLHILMESYNAAESKDDMQDALFEIGSLTRAIVLKAEKQK